MGPVYRPTRRKIPTLWGGTYLYGLYQALPPRGKMTLIELHYFVPWTFNAKMNE